MKVEKEKRKVSIICAEGSLLTGFIHINPGERLSDFLNDDKKTFLVLTDAESQDTEKMRLSKLIGALAKRNTILLNKSSVIMVKEL